MGNEKLLERIETAEKIIEQGREKLSWLAACSVDELEKLEKIVEKELTEITAEEIVFIEELNLTYNREVNHE